MAPTTDLGGIGDNIVVSIRAHRHSNTPAIIVPSTASLSPAVVSHADLDYATARFQTELANCGVGLTTSIALCMPNGIEFVVAFLASLTQRATVAPVNPAYQHGEAVNILQQIKPALCLVHSETHIAQAAHDLGIPVVHCVWDRSSREMTAQWMGNTPLPSSVPVVPLSAICQDDNGLLLFTSGTTGAPKGVELTHRNLLVAVRILTRAHRLSPLDRCAIITPLFHIAGLGASLLPTLILGGTAVIPPSLSGGFWKEIHDHGVTWYHAVPTLHRLLLTLPRPATMPPLRFIRSGGSSLLPDIAQRLETELNVPVLEIYGMTETAPGIFCNVLEEPRRLAYYPIPPEISVRILRSDTDDGPPTLTDDIGVTGEICVSGPSMMKGYKGRSGEEDQVFFNGFFRTGDLGLLEDAGHIRLTGRIKETINKGGDKIHPTEVEEVYQGHEAIEEAVCFRIEDDIYGENIGLAIVLKEGHKLGAREVKAFARNKISHAKIPKKVVFVSSLPRNPTGKYQRHLLSREYGAA